MEKGILKVKVNRKVFLKIGKSEVIPPKVFIFDGFEPNNYDCDVELDKGAIVRIVVNGKDIPKDDQVILKKQARADEKEARDKLEKELAKMQEQQENSGDSYVLARAQVPADTRSILLYDSDNFHLKLNRFARFEDDKFYFFRQDKKAKQFFQIRPSFGDVEHDYFSNLTTRAAAHATALLGKNNLSQHTFTPNWRLIVGLGGESVYETSMTLHHIYGFPYIPASSIKGVLRSFIIAEKFENKEGAAIENQAFCDVFGCPAELPGEKDGKKKTYSLHYKEARQGKVLFFDAFPTKAPQIKPDVMNPHYPEWYGKGKPPTDTQSPIPVFFLTVVDTPFQFLFGSKKMEITSKFFGDKTLGEWLKDALTEHGIGAKTAVGYGMMKQG